MGGSSVMENMDTTALSGKRFALADLTALVERGVVSGEQARQWEQRVRAAADGDEAWKQGAVELRAWLQHDLHDVISRIREELNMEQQTRMEDSDLLAMAAGGVMGAFNAWVRRPTPATASIASSSSCSTTPTPAAVAAAAAPASTGIASHASREDRSSSATAATSLWASALDAAGATLRVMRERRQVEHFHIKHLEGNEMDASIVMLCINGFMTQGSDPLRNWQAWSHDRAGVVAYAVLWEAGDVGVWNEFCAHANDDLTTSLMAHVSRNPWHKAQDKAHHVGLMLARVLAAKPAFLRGRQVVLMGHSLGAAVIMSALKELSRLESASSGTGSIVHSAILFGGAFVPEAAELRAAVGQLDPVHGRLVNVFSANDCVLSKLFWATQLHRRENTAAGCAPIDFAAAEVPPDVGFNVDVTDVLVPAFANQFGHSYGPFMDQVRCKVERLVPLLVSTAIDAKRKGNE